MKFDDELIDKIDKDILNAVSKKAEEAFPLDGLSIRFNGMVFWHEHNPIERLQLVKEHLHPLTCAASWNELKDSEQFLIGDLVEAERLRNL